MDVIVRVRVMIDDKENVIGRHGEEKTIIEKEY